MRIKTILLIGLTVVLFNCQNKELINISLSEKNKYINLTLNDDNLKQPFQFISGSDENTGSVFFETQQGKTWIKGEPVKITNTDDHFMAEWLINGRTITITIQKEEHSYLFSIQSEPDAGIIQWGFLIASSNDEYFTGLFERVVDGDQKESWKEGINEAMDLRGQKVEMIIKPTLSLYCPFYLSSNNYGLFINGTWPGHYDFCATDPQRVSITFEGPSLSGILYTSDEPAEIVKAHSLHVGPAIVPPKWAFLPWRWRDNHTNMKTYFDGTPVDAPYNSMVVEDILMMNALDIPCGVYWIDRPWAKGYKGYEDFEWDPGRLPNATEMIRWIHRNDMKLLLWIAPWVAGEMKLTADENHYSQPLKGAFGGLDTSKISLLDLTNPEACKWWQEKGIEKMLRQGVNGFKLDRSEELVPESGDIILSDGRTAREVRNEYPVLYVKTVHESCKKICGDDFILIPRAGYSGSSKYSGFWGGDIGSPPEGLRTAIIALQRSSIIGFPVWGSDIGGYWNGEFNREVCARWLAFGCFCPIMEFGPTEDRAPWDMAKEPHYDTELVAIWRLYAKIHETLSGYTYDLTVEASKTGMPVARPLFLEYPEQEMAWKDWQTYKYGPDILVSAIWQKGKKTHTCYLPEGNKWIDAWNKEKVYDGGQVIKVETPVYKIPIFIRKGSVIDPGDLNTIYSESLEIAKNKPDLKKLEKEFLK